MAEDSGTFTSDSGVAWLWVIEYLASFKEIDPGTLHDLIEAAPDFPKELGKNTREMVALRCLEDFFGNSDEPGNDNHFAHDERIAFDLSESCEEVLQLILQETSVSDLRKGGTKLLKWDIQPFIMHKKASMPKCALEHLKDAILQGTHPCASTLRQLSGLLSRDDNCHGISLDYTDRNTVSQRIHETSTHVQIMTSGENSSVPLENDNAVVGVDSLDGNLFQRKRDRSDLATESLHGDYCENQDSKDGADNLFSNAKRLKKDDLFSKQLVGHSLISQCDKELVENSSEKMVEGTEKDDYQVEKEAQRREVENCRPLEDGHNECVVNNGIGQSPNDNNEFQHNQIENEVNAKGMSEHTPGGPTCQFIFVDKAGVEPRISNEACCEITEQVGSVYAAKDNRNLGDQLKSANGSSSNGFHGDNNVDEAGGDNDDISEEDTSGDSDEYCHERVDVSMERSHFLSSQCPLGNDSAAVSDWTEQNLCVKCNENGQLLVCSFAGCPLVIHENCLGTPARFDDKGDFYCPFCTYSLAISKYLEAKKKASLARKELSVFLRNGLGRQQTKETRRLPNKEHKNLRQNRKYVDIHDRQDNEISGKKESNQINDEVRLCEVNVEHQFPETGCYKQQVEPSTSRDANLQGGKEKLDNNRTKVDNTITSEKESEEMVQKRTSSRLGGQEDQVCTDPKVSDNNLLHTDRQIARGSRRQQRKIQKEVGEQQTVDSSEKPVCVVQIHGDASDDENAASIIANYSIRKREKHYSYPAIPQLRRKKMPWSVEEEEILKKGVKKFFSVHDKNIPWKKILEYGSSIFHGRTTIDLKDKWRNMCKGSPKVQ